MAILGRRRQKIRYPLRPGQVFFILVYLLQIRRMRVIIRLTIKYPLTAHYSAHRPARPAVNLDPSTNDLVNFASSH